MTEPVQFHRYARGGGYPEKHEKTAVRVHPASQRNGTLYIGVTSDIVKRGWEHRNNVVDGFTKKHDVHRLVYYELHDDMMSAITREKQLKKWYRA